MFIETAHHTYRGLLKSSLIFVFVTVITLVGLQACGAKKRKAIDQTYVRGTLVVEVHRKRAVTHSDVTSSVPSGVDIVHIPGVEVTFTNKLDGSSRPKKNTDLSGRFSFNRVAPGDYSVCWQAEGFVSECRDVTISAAAVHLGLITIQVTNKNGYSTVYGKVEFADRSSLRTYSEQAGLNVYANATLVSAKGDKLHRAYVNNFGRYLIPHVPHVPSNIIIEIEKEHYIRTLSAEVVAQNVFLESNITLGNHQPKINTVLTFSSSKRVRSAATNDILTVRADVSDEDGDRLDYLWLLSPGNGTISSSTDPEINWTMAAGLGLQQLRLIVNDQRGGYSTKVVSVNKNGIGFRGQVKGSDGALLDGARVVINGKTFTTANGGLSARVKEADRYVFNIYHKGYRFISQIYDSGVTSGTWTLSRVQKIVADPKSPIVVVEVKEQGDCRGTVSSGIDWAGKFKIRGIPRFQDGKGHYVNAKPKRELLEALKVVRARDDCNRLPAKLKIPANALEDGSGQAPAGSVDIYLSSIDLRTPQAMPGDMSVGDGAGNYVGAMQSWGALTVDIIAGGTRYDLAPGAKATISIPIDSLQLNAPGAEPNIIPLLFYQEDKGAWVQQGNLIRTGNYYEAEVEHFSAYNSDLIKTGNTCVRLNSAALPSNDFLMEVVVSAEPGSGDAPEIIYPWISSYNDDPWHVLYNLPTERDIVIVPFGEDPENPGTDIPYGTFVVNTGPEMNPSDENPPLYNYPGLVDGDGSPVDTPYPQCHAEVILQIVDLPDPPADFEFLSGLTSFHAGNLNELNVSDPLLSAEFTAATERYYDLVDPAIVPTPAPGLPQSRRETLDAFKAHHGFVADSTSDPDQVSAAYANTNDLGFGRLMVCRKNPVVSGVAGYTHNIACYVTNFGAFPVDDDIEDFQRVADEFDNTIADIDKAPAVATVAMEYAAVENPDGSLDPAAEPIVKFFVYAGDGFVVDGNTVDQANDNQRITAANLDDVGARPVPQLCMVCHGGVLPAAWNSSDELVSLQNLWGSPGDENLGARFLPFDLQAFTIDDSYKPALLLTTADQEDDFKQLNGFVADSVPDPLHPIRLVIDELYAGGSLTQLEDITVDGWEHAPGSATPDLGVEQMYTKVFDSACRVCHIAQPDSEIDFDDVDEFIVKKNAVTTRVCNDRVMPHARATYLEFWHSYEPHKPAIFDAFMLNFAGQANICGDYFNTEPNDLNPEQTDFSDFENATISCSGCHDGSFAGNCGPGGGDIVFDSAVRGSMVNVGAQESGLDLVDPSSLSQSYLWHKVKQTHAAAPANGCGGPMPFPSGFPAGIVNDDDVDGVTSDKDVIQRWIEQGALP